LAIPISTVAYESTFSTGEYLQLTLNGMYGDDEGPKVAELCEKALIALFDDYKRIYSNQNARSVSSSSSDDATQSFSFSQSVTDRGVAKDSKSELDRYLTEEIEGDEAYFKSGDFTVLGWWKRRSPTLPVLSLVARDILAIPISTVAYESTFSTGVDVAVNLEENIDDLEKFKDEMGKTSNANNGEDECSCKWEKTIPLRDIISQLPPSVLITTFPPVLTIEDPEDSLIMGNEELSAISKKESDEVINSSVEDFVPSPSESEDTSGSDSECDLPSCDDFSPINDPEGKSVTFSNPLFDSNDDFTSSDDESLSDEDVLKGNVKIYSNPLFEFDDEYISSNVNPLFDEVLEDMKSEASFDESTLLVTPLSDANEDECFDPEANVDEINAFDIPLDFEDGYYDSEGDVLYLDSLLSDDTTPNLPPEVFLDRDPRSLSDVNDLKIMVKIFDPGILEKFFSPTYVSLPFEDRHYFSLTYVI
nr:zinc finger BED domain-containing protein RICESLEEPER 2-like [Tanacetum cinerariifolium]